ncbi:MAG: hypothetical protein AAF717_10950 [Bacteroidota bacterium]
MRHAFFIVLLFAVPLMATAQTEEGSWLVEVNTGTLAIGNTAFSLSSVDGNTSWSVGAEGGYFVTDDLALKVGLGYGDAGEFSDGVLVYKLGGKYYINGQIPVGLDFTGISSDGNSANWVGAQGGYAVFLGETVAIEPALRYNFTLDEDEADSVFQALIGFTIFL